MTTSKPRPVFLYGTLRAKSLLAWALTGDASDVSLASQLIQPAKVYGHARFALKYRDYPAAVKHAPSSSIDGYLFIPETTSQRKKLDDFEGEAYKPAPVDVIVFDSNGSPREETVGADMYLWAGDEELLTAEPWVLEVFERERLEDWLGLFEGMELVGEDEDDDAVIRRRD
ncbi:hypothetical protein F4781DRAFT_122263 [Annulohypoxylon bovei var. microspora]|nr:hypothetical protein F4781DRAFT_122263 [Annulohypoxylon bovei var. microspora]